MVQIKVEGSRVDESCTDIGVWKLSNGNYLAWYATFRMLIGNYLIHVEEWDEKKEKVIKKYSGTWDVYDNFREGLFNSTKENVSNIAEEYCPELLSLLTE